MTACEKQLGVGGEPKDKTPSVLDVDITASTFPAVHSPSKQPKTPSKDVATLVSRLGSAPAGEEREAALEAIETLNDLIN